MSAAQFDEELFWLMTVYVGQRMWLAFGQGPAAEFGSAGPRQPGVYS